MGLVEDLERTAERAAEQADAGEKVAAVLAAEPTPGARGYLCAFEGPASERSWLALDAEGKPLDDRRGIRDIVFIAALCELAEESAAGGDLEALRSRLESLRGSDRDHEVDEAVAALEALQRELGSPPQLATPGRLDAIGQATRRLELALDPTTSSPFAEAMRAAQGAVEELTAEVESTYRADLASG
jgi:hypothetical protein